MDGKIEVALIAAFAAAFTALIGAAVSLIGMWVSHRNARRQMDIQVETKIYESRIQLENKINELTQTQMKDIVAKRIEVYPSLWLIAQTHLSDLERARKLTNPGWVPDDVKWAGNLLAKLMEWHQQYGVFLSQECYEAFTELRNQTADLVRECGEKRPPKIEEFQKLDKIYYKEYFKREGPELKKKLPLATMLKNDLGSYKPAIISHAVDQSDTPNVTDESCPKVQ